MFFLLSKTFFLPDPIYLRRGPICSQDIFYSISLFFQSPVSMQIIHRLQRKQKCKILASQTFLNIYKYFNEWHSKNSRVLQQACTASITSAVVEWGVCVSCASVRRLLPLSFTWTFSVLNYLYIRFIVLTYRFFMFKVIDYIFHSIIIAFNSLFCA